MAENRSVRFTFIGHDRSAGRTMDNLAGKSDRLHGKTSVLGKWLKRGLAVGGAAAAAGLAKSISAAASFDDTMRKVAIQTGQSGKGLKSLSDLALKMGADTVFSAKDASQAMLELAKGGLTAAEIKGGGLAATMKLAAAGELNMGNAATYVVNTMKQFGLKAGDADRVVTALAGGANASTASVESLGMALSQVGPGAKLAGMSVEETVGVLAAFDNMGLKGSDAGTSLKTMFQRLVPTTDKAKNAMKDLGLKFTDANGNILPMAQIAEQLKTKLSGLSQSQKQTALTTIFGSDAYRAAAAMADLGAAGVNKYVKAAKDSDAAQRMANAGMQGATGAWENFTGAVETLSIQIGTKLLPVWEAFLRFLADKVVPLVGRAIEAVGGAITRIVSRIDFSAIGKKLAQFGAFVRDSLWPPLQRLGSAIKGVLVPALQVIGNVIRSVVLPVLGVVAGFIISKILPALIRFTAAVLRNKDLLIASAAAIGGYIVTVKAIALVSKVAKSATLAWAAAQKVLNLVMKMSTLGLIVAGIAALVAIIVLAWKRSETFRKVVTAVWNGIKAAAAVAWSILKKIFMGLFGYFRGLWHHAQNAGNYVSKAWNFIKAAANLAWKGIKAVISGYIKYLKFLWSIVIKAKNVIVAAWGLIRRAIGSVWGFIKGVIAAFVKGLRFLWSIVLRAKNVIVTAWNLIRRAIGAVWNWIKQNVIKPWATLFRFLGFVAVKLRDRAVSAWHNIRSKLGAAWSWIRKYVVQPWQRFFAILWRVAIRLKNIAVNAWNSMRAKLGAGWNWIRDRVFAPLRRGFQNVWDKAVQIKNGIVTAWNRLREGTVRAFNKLKSAIKRPINAVINWVNDKIIKGLNKVTSKFGLTIPKIPGLNSGGEAGSKAGRGSTRGMRMSGGLTRNRGGEIPGVGIDRDKVLTNLTPGESVFTRTRTKELKAMGGIGAVDAINRKGWDSVFGGASGRDRHATDAIGGIADWIKDKAGKTWDFTKSVFAGVKASLQTDKGKAALDLLSKSVMPLIDNGLKTVVDGKPDMASKFIYGVFQKLKGHIKNWLVGEDEKEAAKLVGSLGILGAGKFGGVGLSGEQVKNALIIMNVAKAVGASTRDAVIGIMTAMQESNLRNIRYGDRDSLGLFQQRAAWGPASARLNPLSAARMFFRGGRRGQPGLLDIKRRNKMSLSGAAQAVQRSAFPGAYAKWASMAKAIVKAAKQAGAGGQVSSGRIMKPGTYRVGRGSRAHGYASQDLPAPMGTKVYSPWAGTASRKSMRTSYGKHVFVKGFSHGLTFLAAHLSKHVGGKIVQQGQVIGLSGSTGNSTGPHVHVEVRRGRTRLEPRRYLKYDDGGVLPPGRSLVRNSTGKPEYVFTDAQMRAMRPHHNTGAQTVVLEVHNHNQPMTDPQAAGRAVVDAVETYLLRGGTVGPRFKKAVKP